MYNLLRVVNKLCKNRHYVCKSGKIRDLKRRNRGCFVAGCEIFGTVLRGGAGSVVPGAGTAVGAMGGAVTGGVAGFTLGVYENTYMISVGTLYCALRDAGVTQERAGELAALLAVPYAGLQMGIVTRIPVVKKMLGNLGMEALEGALKDPRVLRALAKLSGKSAVGFAANVASMGGMAAVEEVGVQIGRNEDLDGGKVWHKVTERMDESLTPMGVLSAVNLGMEFSGMARPGIKVSNATEAAQRLSQIRKDIEIAQMRGTKNGRFLETNLMPEERAFLSAAKKEEVQILSQFGGAAGFKQAVGELARRDELLAKHANLLRADEKTRGLKAGDAILDEVRDAQGNLAGRRVATKDGICVRDESGQWIGRSVDGKDVRLFSPEESAQIDARLEMKMGRNGGIRLEAEGSGVKMGAKGKNAEAAKSFDGAVPRKRISERVANEGRKDYTQHDLIRWKMENPNDPAIRAFNAWSSDGRRHKDLSRGKTSRDFVYSKEMDIILQHMKGENVHLLKGMSMDADDFAKFKKKIAKGVYEFEYFAESATPDFNSATRKEFLSKENKILLKVHSKQSAVDVREYFAQNTAKDKTRLLPEHKNEQEFLIRRSKYRVIKQEPHNIKTTWGSVEVLLVELEEL